MTLEQAFITAISGVVAALCYLFRLLWQRSQECEQWRKEKGPEIEEMERSIGSLSSIVSLVQSCKTDGCNFAGKVETFSMKPKKTP